MSVPADSFDARAVRAAYAHLFDTIHEGMFVGAIDRDRRWVTFSANPHLRSMFGYAPDAPVVVLAPFAPERFADPSAHEVFVDRLRSDGALTDCLLRMRRMDGSAMWVEVTASAEPEEDQLRVGALVRDVSRRKKLDDQSRDLYQQLLQAEKMAALGQTLSGVTHELNNPLATILSWAERLSARDLDEEVRRGLTVVLAEADRAARIVRNLLTFARKRASTRHMVDINQVVADTLGLRAYEHKLTNIHVVTALEPDLPLVFADPHQIQQVLLNLVINAEQAMLSAHGGGTLAIRTWQDADRDTLAFEVSDDGPGVPPEARTQIFDPFFTTKEVGQGTGLGLTVAYAIVQEHGGQIRVDSRPQEGASFVVELLLSGRDAVAPKARAPSPPMEAVRGASVLLVEDEHALADAVRDALTDAGLDVDHAGDGEEALARVRHKTYDAIVCDLRMPRVDGRTLYRAIAAGTPALARRVVFVTGDVAGTDAERFLEESGCRWLAKPFRLADLLRAVRETLG